MYTIAILFIMYYTNNSNILLYCTNNTNTTTLHVYTPLYTPVGSSTRLHLQTDLAKRIRIQEERRQVLPITPPPTSSTTSSTTGNIYSNSINNSNMSGGSSGGSEYDLEKHGLISDGLLDFDNGDFGHHLPTSARGK